MYARFFTKALADLGHLDFQEPFSALFTQGMITRDGAKMSKSRGNVVSPGPLVERYGVDTARAYILFIGPPDQDADWSDEGLEGVHRFLGRLWRLSAEAAGAAPDGDSGGVATGGPGAGQDGTAAGLAGADLELVRKAHWAIDKVTHDMDGRFAFNTAIAAVMELVNDCSRLRDAVSGAAMRFALTTAASLIFPFAPHTGTDAFHLLTGRRVWEEPWPVADPAMLAADTFELVCQVMGKLRDRVSAPTAASSDELRALALAAPNVQTHIAGREIVKVVVVPGKLVNVVVR
jgi:leucyl-tRNA synthetase